MLYCISEVNIGKKEELPEEFRDFVQKVKEAYGRKYWVIFCEECQMDHVLTCSMGHYQWDKED